MGVAAAVLLAALAVPAGAAERGASLSCTLTSTEDVHPGMTMTTSVSAATTHGLTGTATCSGIVGGLSVAGPGTFGKTDVGVGNCLGGTAVGTYALRLPTSAGPRIVAGKFKVTYGVAGVVFTGDLVGTQAFTPLVGDCVNTPLTRLSSVLTVTVTT